MITVGIIGATGYAGVELLRLLLGHPEVRKIAVSSVSFEGQRIDDVYPNLSKKCDFVLEDAGSAVEKSDIVFTALPHGLAELYADTCVKTGKKLIDLSADFRFDDDEETFTEYYKKPWEKPKVHTESVYGLPEMNRDKIKGARVVGNPGCYPTSATLALLPALKNGIIDTKTIIVDSKSGVTGAGRSQDLRHSFCEAGEAISVYSVGTHRHRPEIERNCRIASGKDCGIVFTPHLVPMSRGIITDVYASLTLPVSENSETSVTAIRILYENFYRSEPFVRILKEGIQPTTRNVRYSNYCDIQIYVVGNGKMLQIVSTLDNMIKGAAGQAIQNMNLLEGFNETCGLCMIPPAF